MAGVVGLLGKSIKTFGLKNTLTGAKKTNAIVNTANKLGHVGVGAATGAVAGAGASEEGSRLNGALTGGLIGAAGGSLAKGMAMKSNAVSAAKGFGAGTATGGLAGTLLSNPKTVSSVKAAIPNLGDKGAMAASRAKTLYDKGLEKATNVVGKEKLTNAFGKGKAKLQNAFGKENLDKALTKGKGMTSDFIGKENYDTIFKNSMEEFEYDLEEKLASNMTVRQIISEYTNSDMYEERLNSLK